MYKKIFSAAALVACLLQTRAQLSVAAEAGLSYNMPDADISNMTSARVRPGYGYAFALNFSKSISHHFSLQLLPGVQQKSFSIRRTGDLKGIYMEQRNTYLQLPLLLRYRLNHPAGKVYYYAEMGGYYAYWLAGREIGEIPDIFGISSRVNSTGQREEVFQLEHYSAAHHFDDRVDRRDEWGWTAGGEVHYGFNKRRELSLAIRYYQSLTSRQKSDPASGSGQYDRVWNLSIGYIIVL